MTLRRLSVAMMVVFGLCVWGFAHSSDTPAPSGEPVESGSGRSHDEAAARYRTSQSNHWRHVAVGNNSCDR